MERQEARNKLKGSQTLHEAAKAASSALLPQLSEKESFALRTVL